MAEREAFLRRIRERAQHVVHFPGPDPGQSVPQSVLRGDEPFSELIEHFTAMLTDVGGRVVRVPDAAAAREWLVDFAQERSPATVVMDRGLPTPDLADSLAAVGVRVVVAPAGADADRAQLREEFRAACAAADVGITGAAYAVADTGTLVALAGPGRPRTTSVLPPVHVAVVRGDRMVANLRALLTRLRSAEWRHGRPSAMTFITGPSRTADIEQTLSIGVHGPGEVHVVMIETAAQDTEDGDDRTRR